MNEEWGTVVFVITELRAVSPILSVIQRPPPSDRKRSGSGGSALSTLVRND